MPTVTRFLLRLAIIAGVVYGVMVALALLVEPRKGEMSVEVPLDRLKLDAKP